MDPRPTRRRKLGQGLNKSAPVSRDKYVASKADIDDVLLRFPNWNEADLLKEINKNRTLGPLAKYPLKVALVMKDADAVHTYSKNKLEGYLIASRGSPNNVRCTTCRMGRGPFENGECRSVVLFGSRVANGACGIDIWSGQGTKCNHSTGYNKARYGFQKDHIETKRRMGGFQQNQDIDKADELEDIVDVGGSCPPGYQRIGNLLAPAGLAIEQLEEALFDGIAEVRVRDGYRSLHTPSWFNLSDKRFKSYVEKQGQENDGLEEEEEEEEEEGEYENSDTYNEDATKDMVVIKVE